MTIRVQTGLKPGHGVLHCCRDSMGGLVGQPGRGHRWVTVLAARWLKLALYPSSAM